MGGMTSIPLMNFVTSECSLPSSTSAMRVWATPPVSNLLVRSVRLISSSSVPPLLGWSR